MESTEVEDSKREPARFGMADAATRSEGFRVAAAALGDAPAGPLFDVWSAALAIVEFHAYDDRPGVRSIDVEMSAQSARRAVSKAEAVYRQALENDPEAVPFMARPFMQISGARKCLKLRVQVEAGDGWAVVEATAICALHALPIPGWLASQFVSRYQRVAIGDAKSWDEPEVFGPPVPKGMNIAGVRAIQQTAPKAHRLAVELLEAEPGRALDKGFYEEVGRSLGIGGTRADELIRQHVAAGDGVWPPVLTDLKRYLLDGLSVGEALCRMTDDQMRREWRNAGYTDEQFEEAEAALAALRTEQPGDMDAA